MKKNEQGVEYTILEAYPPGWKALKIGLPTPRPTGLRTWLRVLWGLDIFLGPVPFLKVAAVVGVAGFFS